MIAEILKELIAAGLQGESLIAAVERIEQAQPKAIDATAERRRAKDRERYHLRKQQKPPKTTETMEVALTSLLSSVDLIEKQKENKEVSKKVRARKSALPDDWMPNPAHHRKADELRLSPRFVNQKADDMRNWAKSKAVQRADWDATFYTFLKPQTNGGGNGQYRETLEDRCNRLADEARRLETAAGIRREDDAVRRD